MLWTPLFALRRLHLNVSQPDMVTLEKAVIIQNLQAQAGLRLVKTH